MRARDVEPEYLELVDPRTLRPRAALDSELLLLVAGRIGATRLIDNVTVTPAGASASPAIDPAAARAARRKDLVTCNE